MILSEAVVAKLIARLIALAGAVPAGYWIFLQMSGFYKGHVPYTGGAVGGLIVFSVLYFALVKPIVMQIADRYFWVTQRKAKMGTGVSQVPHSLQSGRGLSTPGASVPGASVPGASVPGASVPPPEKDRKSSIPAEKPSEKSGAKSAAADVKCRFCGKPGAEVCPDCAKEWNIS